MKSGFAQPNQGNEFFFIEPIAIIACKYFLDMH